MHSLAQGGGGLWGINEFPIPKPANVLYAEFELGPYALQKRVKERYDTLRLKPPPNLYFTSKPIGMLLDTSSGLSLLQKDIDATEAQVVVIDPVSRAILGSENSNDDINSMFRQLGNLQAKQPTLSIVMIHHFSRPPRDQDDFDELSYLNFRGATKFTDAVDTIITLQRLPKAEPEELWRIKSAYTMRQESSPDPIILSVRPGGLILQAKDMPKPTGSMRGVPRLKGTW
jgi:RecA-family ATPase